MTDRPADWMRGDWLQTYTGRAFYPFDPRPDDIDPTDIAHALSLLCRYAGHVARMYSVAEHCVLVSHAVPAEHALWGLLHDATEAYLVDLPRPVKRALPEYVAAERTVMDAICFRFGLEPSEPPAVKEADTRILCDERAELMGPSPLPWKAVENVQPLGCPIEGWEPKRAEAEYTARLAELWP